MLQLETHNFYYNYAKNVPLIRRGRLSISKEIRSIVTTLVRNILHRTIRHKFPATMEIIQKIIGCQEKTASTMHWIYRLGNYIRLLAGNTTK